MSKVDELISELCPNGVVTRTVGDLCQIRTGKKDVNQGNPKGAYPFFTCSRNHTYSDTYSFDGEALLIAGNGDVGLVQYFKGKFEAYQRTYVLMNFGAIHVQFLSHYLRAFLVQHLSVLKQDGTIPYIKLGMLKDFEIPVPPMEVQQEIVRILDTFTELEALLAAQIEATYRLRVWMQDALFNSAITETPAKYVSVLSAAKYVRGLTYSKTAESNDGPILVLRANNIDQESNTLNFQDVRRLAEGTQVKVEQKLRNGDILMSTASGSRSHVGKVCYIQEDLDYYFGGFMAVFRVNEEFHAPYLFHLLSSRSFQEFLDSAIESTTINNLSASLLEKFLIPSLDIKSQMAISSKLDLLSDLIRNLQSELNLRRKQYEYYRRKLLNFNVLDVA